MRRYTFNSALARYFRRYFGTYKVTEGHSRRVAGRVTCGVKVRSRRHRWLAKSVYGAKLGSFESRRDAINAVLSHFGGL